MFNNPNATQKQTKVIDIDAKNKYRKPCKNEIPNNETCCQS